MGKTLSEKEKSRIKIILIIGIVLIVTIPALMDRINSYLYHRKLVNIAAKASLLSVEHAIQRYKVDNNQLPVSLDDLTEQQNGNGPYLIPSELLDPWEQKFSYTQDKSHSKGFLLFTVSPAGKTYANQ